MLRQAIGRAGYCQASRQAIRAHRSFATQNSPEHCRKQANAGLLIVASILSLGGLGFFWQTSGSSKPERLSYSRFTPLHIKSIEKITSDSSIISLALPTHLLPDPSRYPDPPDQPLQAIYVRQPELQIQRAYTPLDARCFSTAEGKDGDREVNLLVKRYNDGEVSSYLHRLRSGDSVDVRGPVRTWTLPECDHLVFIAGGTGITPMAQLLSTPNALPARVTVISSSSKGADSLLQHAVAKTDNLTLYEVSGRLQTRDLQRWVGKPKANERTQIIVCGPEGFIADIAGTRQLNAAEDTTSGVLGSLGWTSKEVKKL